MTHQLADILTKPLPIATFAYMHTGILGARDAKVYDLPTLIDT